MCTAATLVTSNAKTDDDLPKNMYRNLLALNDVGVMCVAGRVSARSDGQSECPRRARRKRRDDAHDGIALHSGWKGEGAGVPACWDEPRCAVH